MPLNFDKYAQKGNEFLNRLAVNLGDEKNVQQAGRVLRSVLRVLRQHLTIEESFQLLAQLPIALKGVYVDGWKISAASNRIQTMKEFAAEIMIEDGDSSWRDFSSTEEAIRAIKGVWLTLAETVSKEEMEQVAGVLPKGIRKELETWLREESIAGD